MSGSLCKSPIGIFTSIESQTGRARGRCVGGGVLPFYFVELVLRFVDDLFFQEGGMTHVLNDDAFVKYFVGENPIFLEYCTPISEPVPFFEAAQGIIGCSG